MSLIVFVISCLLRLYLKTCIFSVFLSGKQLRKGARGNEAHDKAGVCGVSSKVGISNVLYVDVYVYILYVR